MEDIKPWPLPMPTLSPSAMASFSRCSEKFRRNYILGQWHSDASASSVMGNAVHGAAEVNFFQKRDTGVDLSITDVETACVESFDNEVEKYGGPREIDWSVRVGGRRVDLRPGQAKDKAVPLARMYRTEISPSIQPLGTEEWFRIDVPDVPVPIRGKIDLITDTVKADLKFGANLKKQPETSWRLQALTYMLVEETTERNGQIRLANLGSHAFEWHSGSFGGPRSEPKVVTPREEPELRLENNRSSRIVGQALIKSTVEAIIAYWNRFGPDDPWPGGLQHSWVCNFCNFHPSKGGDCFWWGGSQKDDIITLL